MFSMKIDLMKKINGKFCPAKPKFSNPLILDK